MSASAPARMRPLFRISGRRFSKRFAGITVILRKSETTPAGGDEPSAPDGVSAEGSADTPAVADTPAPEQPASKAAADRPRRKRGRQPGSPTPPRERRPGLPVVFNRIQLAMRVLEELERLSILALPARKGPERGRQAPLSLGQRSAPQAPLEGPLAQLEPLRLRLVSERAEAGLWNEFLERYHPLGYRQPIGCHLRYFLEDRQQRLLGCLLYDFAARYLPVRDRWIGWQDQPSRPLERVVRQARFLLFPWVRVKCLASKALGLSLRQLAADWQHQHGVRPVLAETYVSQPYAGTCYRASNWHYLGQTQARGAMGAVPAKTPKAVFVYPLQRDWQALLLAPQRPARSR